MQECGGLKYSRRMPKTKWTVEVLCDLAKPYKTRTAFKNAHKQAYGAVMDKKLGDIVFAHMELMRTYWTEEMLQASVISYTDIETYKRENESAYTTICNRGLREKLLSHIERKHKTHTDKSLAELAKKFNTRSEFSRSERAAYNIAINRGILNSICAHMTRLQKESWSDQELQDLANQCESRQEFKNKYPSAHSISKKRNLLDVFFQNKKKLVIPFTKEEVLEIALKYQTRVDFQKNDGGAYNKALRDGFIKQACSHMSAAQKFRSDLPSTIYLLKIESKVHGQFVGYGITNDWDDRYRDHKNSLQKSGMSIFDIKTFEVSSGAIAKQIEDEIKQKYSVLGVEVRGFKTENCDIDSYPEIYNLVTSLVKKYE